MCEETSGSAYLARACPATTEELLWMWTGSLLCVSFCSLSLHCSILFPFLFSPMFSFCLFSFPFCSSVLILKITLHFLIYVLYFYFFTFVSDLLSYIISCNYSCLCLFPTSFYSSCRRSFAILSHFHVSLSLQIILFFISFFIIYGPASFFPRPQNSKGHWLSHCNIKGASCAEFQPHLVYYILLNFCFIFVIVSLYFFRFIDSLSPLVYLTYIRFIFFSCCLSFLLPIIIYFSFLFIPPAVFSFHEPLHSKFSSSSSSFYFKLFQLYLCFHPFVATCKSKRRFPSHVVMRRASWINLNVVKFSIQLTVTCNRISTFQWRKLLLLL